MPYKRKYRRPRKTTPRSVSLIKSITSALKSKVLQNTLKHVLGLNTDTHWVDTIETNVATNSTVNSMAYPLAIPVDDTSNGRTGSGVCLTSYTIDGRLSSNTAATTGCLVRVMVVKWRNTRGTTPAGTAFLDSGTRITSPYNMGDAASSTGYRVLYDRTFKLAPPGNEGDRQTFSFSYTPKRHYLTWTTTNVDGAASALQDGYISGYIMTDETGANTANYWANHRVKFVDN